MKRRPQDIGTHAETAVVRALQRNGFPHAERRRLRGSQDAGDITGTPGLCWSVKGGAAARAASDGQIILWLRDLDAQTSNAGADAGILVIQRPGKSEANAHRWWAVVRSYHLEMVSSGGRWTAGFWFPVRVQLGDLCELLRASGYGTPRQAPVSVTETGTPPPNAGVPVGVP